MGPRHRPMLAIRSRGVRSADGRSQRDSAQGGSMPIEWDPQAQQWHLHNGRLSVVLAVLENGALGQLYFGAPLEAGRDYRHLARGPFAGYANRVGDADPVRAADARLGRLPPAGPLGAPRGRLAGARSPMRDPPDPRRASRQLPGLPSTYTERCRRGGHAGDRPRRRDQRPDCHRPADHVPRPRGDRPQHHRPQRRPDGRARRAPS